MQTIKKLLLSLGVVLTFIAYSWHQRSDGASAKIVPSGGTGSKISSAGSSTASNSSSKSSHMQNMGSNMSMYKDGTYTGSAADAYYGYIQVQAVISGGKITDVKFLQYPNDQENSIYINQQAMPYLKQEAIQAQSGNVNIITGATDSSQAFIQSMNDALNQAQRG